MHKKLPATLVGEIDSDFDPTKLVYVQPPQVLEENKQTKSKQTMTALNNNQSSANNRTQTAK